MTHCIHKLVGTVTGKNSQQHHDKVTKQFYSKLSVLVHLVTQRSFWSTDHYYFRVCDRASVTMQTTQQTPTTVHEVHSKFYWHSTYLQLSSDWICSYNKIIDKIKILDVHNQN